MRKRLTVCGSDIFVAAVAVGRCPGMLAIAQPNLLPSGDAELQWPKTGSLVTEIAEGLMPAESARAPEMPARFHIHKDWLESEYLWFTVHGFTAARTSSTKPGPR